MVKDIDYNHDSSDLLGNVLAAEGVDRCLCGSKYWEHDHCHSCGEAWHPDCALDTDSGEW